jgi:beta-galactosidase
LAIEDGQVNGNKASFKVGRSTYSGVLNGDHIELDRKINFPSRYRTPEAESTGGPAVGPPPDGSDPSRGTRFHLPTAIQVVLRRVQR